MNSARKRDGMWIIGLVLLFALLAGCGRSTPGGGSETGDGGRPPVIEPYTGPCPAGQSSWDCMVWDIATWE